MKPVNYTNMNDQELKQYLLEHKDNKEAFYAYLDRKQQQPKQRQPEQQQGCDVI